MGNITTIIFHMILKRSLVLIPCIFFCLQWSRGVYIILCTRKFIYTYFVMYCKYVLLRRTKYKRKVSQECKTPNDITHWEDRIGKFIHSFRLFYFLEGFSYMRLRFFFTVMYGKVYSIISGVFIPWKVFRV